MMLRLLLTALYPIFVLTSLLIGCATDDSSRTETLQNAASVDTNEAMVRVKVWDDTENRPIHERAEIWFRGYGSWWLKRALEHGSAVVDLGRRPIGVHFEGDDAIQFYPSGRNGQEISIPIRMTTEMNPNGSDRDAIMIIIGDGEIEVVGLPIEAATGNPTITFQR